MSPSPDSVQPDFHHKIVYEGERFLILSTCPDCGAATKCSAIDGSLTGWENSHQCESTTATRLRENDNQAGTR